MFLPLSFVLCVYLSVCFQLRQLARCKEPAFDPSGVTRVSGLCRRHLMEDPLCRDKSILYSGKAPLNNSNEESMSRLMIRKIYRIWKEKVTNSVGHIVFPIRLSLFHASHAP